MCRVMLTVVPTVAFLAFAACDRERTTAAPAGPLTVVDAWARPADSGSTGGAYVTLTNTDSVDVSIGALFTAVAPLAQLHETVSRDGMAHMIARPNLQIRRDSTLSMVPGGLHIMLLDLTRALRSGDTVPLTFTLTDGRTVPVSAPVRAP